MSVLFLIYWGCGHFDEESYVGVTFGGNGNDEGYSVQQTTDSGFIITGYTKSFGGGDPDLWLIKTDENGEEEWSKTFGENQNNSIAYFLQETSDGGYIVIGETSPSTSDKDLWLIKTNSNGDELWNNTFGLHRVFWRW